jgi:transcriptional regulator with XRE-family HTH domain
VVKKFTPIVVTVGGRQGQPGQLGEHALGVKFLRLLKDWTQDRLAEAAGVHPASVSLYERGIIVPPRSTRARLAEAAGLPPLVFEQILGVIRYALAAMERAAARLPVDEPPPLAVEVAEAVAPAVLAALGELGFEPALLYLSEHAGLCPSADLLGDLLALEPAQRRRLVDGTKAYRSCHLVVLACEESEQAAARDTAEALELADLARFIAERVAGGDLWSDRLQGYAWAFIGNALRVGGDLDSADRAFVTAWVLWEKGEGAARGTLDPSRILDLEASLRRDQRRWSEAFALLDRWLASSPRGESDGRILLKIAFTHEQRGDYESAVATLERAALRVDPGEVTRQLFGLRFNLAVNLCHLDRHAEAEPLAAEARELAEALSNEIDLRRVPWLEARVDAGLGRREAAIAKLRQVRQEFADEEMAYDAALATLDLAVLLLEENENAEVTVLAGEMVATFERLKVYREALAAFQLFRQAVVQETASAELGRQLLRFLERARHDQELRFEPGPA